MGKKLCILFVAMLVTTSTFVIVSNEFEVKATSGGGGGQDDERSDLDFDWMWDQAITTICNAVYKADPDNKITKGREFGTEGENWSADKIAYFMDTDCGLENAKKIPIGPIKDTELIDRYYTSKLNVIDYLLHIDINSENYHKDIPVNESFVIPMTRPKFGSTDLTFNFTLPDADDIVIKLDPKGDWPVGGTITNYSCINLSITPTNEFDILIGNATYIKPEDSLPDDQEDRLFLFDEEEDECEEKLENVTNATGVLLIHDNNSIFEIEDTASYNYSICRVETSDSNLYKVLDGLENESMIAENILDNTTLVFTNNISQACVPDSDFVILTNRGNWSGEDSQWYYFLYIFNQLRFLFGDSVCKGCIYYKPSPDAEIYNKTHYMNRCTIGCARGGWFRDDYKEMEPVTSDGIYEMRRVIATPALPMFFINYTLGNYLYENRDEALISGYIDQEYLKEKHNGEPEDWTVGATAYNVIGNLTTDRSENVPDPDDPTILISNRFDGWWNEAPFDSGCGAGVVLAIAKYFKDYDIAPKCNITFLFTTGEEYMFRGAQHYSDSNPDRNYSMWIGFDQLAGDWPDRLFEITYNDEYIRTIVENISKIQGYPKRSTANGYYIEHNVTTKFTGAEEDVWKQRDCDLEHGGINCEYECKTICFANEKLPFRHRRGEFKDGKFTAGDIKGIIDREDLNDTLELAWNITKYFTVNPDCWFENMTFDTFDTDDSDSLDDTIRANFSVKTVLPHDGVLVNASLINYYEGTYHNISHMHFSVTSVGKNVSINVTLPEGEDDGRYFLRVDLLNSTGWIDFIINPDGDYGDYMWDGESFYLYPYNCTIKPPIISNVEYSPEVLGYGYNVTISANVSSNYSIIDVVNVNFTYPDDSYHNFTMSNIGNDTYQYVFNDTWQYGIYDFTIWAKDVNGNATGSSEYDININLNATISVCTIKDDYGKNETINLTDPPDGPPLIGYELLDDGKILRIWNKYDSYYFNTSNGIQFTNHKDDYWSHNVLMLGYYNNDIWNLIYRTDNLSGFNKNIISDNETFVNVTIWKDLSYGGYDFRLAIRYYLDIDAAELTVIPYIKNLDAYDIPYVLGFGWELEDIQIDMTPSGDYIEIDGTSFSLNQTLDKTFTDMDSACYYIKEDLTDIRSKSLYLKWNNDLNYKVCVESQTGQYNAPVTLYIRIGTLDVGQEKYTNLYWYDADEIIYYYDGYNTNEA